MESFLHVDHHAVHHDRFRTSAVGIFHIGKGLGLYDSVQVTFIGDEAMPFGLTYASYVGVILIAQALPPSWSDMDGENTLSVTAGANDPDKHSKGRNGFFSVEYRPKQELVYGLQTLYGVGLSMDGAGYATIGIRKGYNFGRVRLEPYFGPAIYQSSLGNFSAKELMQFRAGADVFVGGEDMAVGIGFYHISNARLTSGSAGLDIIHATLKVKF
jgi:hypothetical protein